METKEIQKLINACGNAGGGTVTLPPGTHNAGMLQLKSNVNLHLTEGAVLLQSKEMSDYEIPPRSCYVHGTGSRRVFLHGDRVENVAITGEGEIDGNLALDTSESGGPRRGPLPILFENSRNIRLENITVRNSPGWAVTFFGCRDVDVIGVKCLDSYADGINPVCSQDVRFEGVLIDGAGDDSITIKNEMAGAAPKCGFHTENITVSNTTVRNSGHPGVKIGTGTFGTFRDITVKNCTFENTGAMFVIQLMSPERDDTPDRAIENVTFKDIIMKDVGGLIDVTSLIVQRPIIRNITLQNITVDGLRGRSAIWGLPEAPIEDVMLQDISIKGNAEPLLHWVSDMLPGSKLPPPYWLKARYVHGLTMRQINLILDDTESALICEEVTDLRLDGLQVGDVPGNSGTGPTLTLENVERASIKNCKGPSDRTFLRASGKRSADFELVNNYWGANREPFEVADDSNLKDTLDLPEKPEAASDGAANTSSADSDSAAVTRAEFEFGERMQVVSPAAAGELTEVNVTLKNKGGAAGTKTVTLHSDGQEICSTTMELAPGEETEVKLAHRFGTPGPHNLKVGDFPVWPYVTFANTDARFYQTREKIIIESGGGPHQILAPDRQCAVVYLKAVTGDFVATTRFTVRRVTGPYCGAGLIAKNDIAAPADQSGCVVDWFYPKYAVCHYEDPQVRRIVKNGRELSAIHPVSPEDADSSQDVGIFAHAFSTTGEFCHAEFEHFTVESA